MISEVSAIARDTLEFSLTHTLNSDKVGEINFLSHLRAITETVMSR